MKTLFKGIFFISIVVLSVSCAKKMDQIQPNLLEGNIMKSGELAMPNGYVLVEDFLFIRDKGKPFWETKSFAISHYAESVMIKLVNGPDDYRRVSAADIMLDDQEIFVEHDFNQQVGYLEFNKTKFEGTELKVLLRSIPNSAIGIAIYEKRGNLNR